VCTEKAIEGSTNGCQVNMERKHIVWISKYSSSSIFCGAKRGLYHF
jgi:hypothetical protein